VKDHNTLGEDMMSYWLPKRILQLILAMALLSGCTIISKRRSVASSEKKKWSVSSKDFEGLDACFILYNVNTKKIEKVVGDARCRERTAPCSTFKMPLAVIAFDNGLLKDENTLLKWDGTDRGIASWNRDHTASSWMRDSVVWYSQRLTPQLGVSKINAALKKYNYGTHDVSGGVRDAWLTASPFTQKTPNNTLKISAYEQLEFMKKLWSNSLPAEQRSLDLTKKLTYLEISPGGYILNGKTGSGFFENSSLRLGWFVAHLQKDSQEYISVFTFTDKEGMQKDLFAGQQAKDISKNIFSENGLW